MISKNYIISVFSVITIFLNQPVFAVDNLSGDNPGDYIPNPEIELNAVASQASEFGGVFTPRGDLNVLIIFVTFQGHNVENANWPLGQAVPPWIYDDSFMFNSLADFDNIPSGNKSVSRYYYEMTNQLEQNERFRMYGSFLNVEIDPGTAGSWGTLNRIALDSLESKYSNIEQILHANYDSRRNGDWNQYDRTGFDPDSIVDYVIIDYRYTDKWFNPDSSLNQEPVYGMKNWSGGQGGYAEVNTKDFGTISINWASGFTFCTGINPNVKLFTHEVGHSLYDAPHYGSTNGVLGRYFFTTSFWGMMSVGGNEIHGSANAWERWYLGWIDIKHDLDTVTQNGNYVLSDYMTTGDAIRIKLPYVDHQYLWIENHQDVNIFDQRLNYGEDLCCSSLPDPPQGIHIYLENICDNKSDISIFTQGANGIKLFNADGNYDYSIINSENRCEWCGGLIDNFHKGQTNPYSGNNLASRLLFDKNNNGTITYNTGANSPGNSEQYPFIWVDNNFVFGTLGNGCAFQPGQKIGIATNPAVANFQTYSTVSRSLSPIYLNGISIEVLNKDLNGDITVHIEFDDFNIEDDVRMCGNIVLPPETITLIEGKTVEINTSGTPNRNTLLNGEFINPTIVSTSAGTNFHLMANSTVNITGENALVVDTNSTVELEDGAKIIVNSGSTLRFRFQSSLIIKGSGHIDVKPGGNVCFDKEDTNNVNVNLQDNLSVINLYPGYNNGVNPNVIPDLASCFVISVYPFSGNGSINTFNQDIYVQDETISTDTYYAGNNIYVGNNVTTSKPVGNVIIIDGAKIIFDAVGDVFIKKGFESQNGTFEVKY